jgi:hypothetical protein
MALTRRQRRIVLAGVILVLLLLVAGLVWRLRAADRQSARPTESPAAVQAPRARNRPAAGSRRKERVARERPRIETPRQIIETRLRLEGVLTNDGTFIAELVRTEVAVWEGETAPRRSTASIAVGERDLVNGATVVRISLEGCVLEYRGDTLDLPPGGEVVLRAGEPAGEP